MTSYGSQIACPHCGAPHVIRMGEIGDQRQVTFACAACGKAVAIDRAAALPVAAARTAEQKGFKLKGVD